MTQPAQHPLVAVVDDEPEQRLLLRRALKEADYAVVEAADGREAVELARTHPLDAMLLDVRMPGLNGLEALETIRQERPELLVILLTAYIDVRDAVAAIKRGAHDYLEKPVDLDELIVAVDEALGIGRGLPAAAEAEPVLPEDVVAESEVMRAVFRQAQRMAPNDASVLLEGESGTGKEVVARFIHDQSLRSRGPFVAVNCAALPEHLIESELFGHERGAFTGAATMRTGHFENAAGGTLLLDEIGEMPLALQPKLLRVLQDHTLRRVGGRQEIRLNLRVIAATNRGLDEQVRSGAFREDLLYRLNVLTLRIPPLRERRDDILPLADRFLAAEKLAGKRLSPAAQRLLAEYPWPGNVRELRNAVVRSGILARGTLILPEDLPEPVRAGRTGAPAGAGGDGLTGDMEAIQRKAILAALEQTGGNKTRAAEQLGISRRNLIYKLRSYGL